jgi:hypothetical protein
MDVGSILTAVSIVGTGFGGFVGGRASGRTAASQIATDTVDMLSAQIELLKEDKEHRELEILDLNSRVAVLEGLVTQRAEVEELNTKVSLVKDVVDRIAVRVGA